MVEKTEPDDAILSAKPDDWIRLACAYCDRDDYDFIKSLPSDWHRVSPSQTWEEAIRPPTDDEDANSAWETHLGVCPDCFQAELNTDSSLTTRKTREESDPRHSSTAEASKKVVRLGCAFCDRDEFDGVTHLPTEWYCISPVESVAPMILPVTEEESDLLSWETHLGVCPECYEIEVETDYRERKFRSRKKKHQS